MGYNNSGSTYVYSAAIIPGYSSSYGLSSYNTYWYGQMPPLNSTQAQGSNVYLFPIRTWGITGETSPSIQMMMYYNQDLTAYNPTSIKMWDGVTRTMLPLGSAFTGSATPISSITTAAFAMRFD